MTEEAKQSPKPVQLVLDSDAHEAQFVKPELAKRLREPGIARVKKRIDEVALTNLSRPNPHERTGR